MLLHYFEMILLAIIEFAVMRIIFTCASVSEMYDPGVKREISFIGKRYIFIRPFFSRFMRRRTELWYWIVQTTFFIHIVSGFFLKKADWVNNNDVVVNVYKIAFNCLLLDMAISFIRTWSYSRIETSQLKKRTDVEDRHSDIKEQVICYPENQIIEAAKICKSCQQHADAIMVILPHNHKLNYDGYMKGTEEALREIEKKDDPAIRERLLHFGNQKNNPQKVGAKGYYVQENSNGTFLHNYGNYQKLSAFLNYHSVTTVRLEFKEYCDNNNSFDNFRNELSEIVGELKLSESNHQNAFYLLGHGLYGGLEAVLMSQELKVDGIICIGELGSSIVEMSKNYMKKADEKFWIAKRTAKKRIQSLEHLQELRKCRGCIGMQERFCEGYCIEMVDKYFFSLSKFGNEDLIQIIGKYKGSVLHMNLEEDMYSSLTKVQLEENVNRSRCSMEGLYHTMRASRIKDYSSYDQVTQLKLLDSKKNPLDLMLGKEAGLSHELLRSMLAWIKTDIKRVRNDCTDT